MRLILGGYMKLTEEMRTDLERRYRAAFNNFIEIMLQHIEMILAQIPEDTPKEAVEKAMTQSMEAVTSTMTEHLNDYSSKMTEDIKKRMEAQNG